MATAHALREILSSLRRSGRRVAVHLPLGVDTKGYFIASAAERLSIFPGGSLALLGFASQGVFIRRALEKAGLVVDVIARGRYKSAGDALTRDAMSAPQREQVGALLDVMYASFERALREGRGLSSTEAGAAIDRGIFRADEAVEARLVDAAAFDDQAVAVLVHDKAAPSTAPALVPAETYLRARRATRLGRDRGRRCLGVVAVHGVIVQGASTATSRGAMADSIISAVRAAREARGVGGVLLHIDSPGGSALGSARIHRELELLAAEKPLVAVMGNVAASGGYYVAAPAHAIIAQPVTVTGSIGVIAARFALGPMLQRLGVSFDIEKRGARADLFGAVTPLSDDERAALVHEIDGAYREFIDAVARGRNKSPAEVEAVAEGRVWSGLEARDRGLVDQLGGVAVGLAELRRRIGPSADSWPTRILRGGKAGASLARAEPSPRLASAVVEALGEWTDLWPLACSQERTLAWAPGLGSWGSESSRS